jgi:hypothetical protein
MYEWATQVVGMDAYDYNDAGWTAIEDSGTNGATVAGAPERFDITGDSHNFVDADKGKMLTITGITGTDAEIARNGIYRIQQIISSKVVQLDILHGVHEDGLPSGKSGLNWRLWDTTNASHNPPAGTDDWAVFRGTYSDSNKFDVKIRAGAVGDPAGNPSFTLGPYGTWNTTSHDFDGYDTAESPWAGGWWHNALVYRVWASGDKDRIFIYAYSVTNPLSLYFYFGEITPNYPSHDPRPSIMMVGSPDTNDSTRMRIIGYYLTGDVYNGMRWLSHDNSTTVTGYWQIPSVLASNNTNRIADVRRRWSQWSRDLYRFEVLCECRTSLHMEHRGILKNVWASSRDYFNGVIAFGTNLEYLYLVGGIVIPWNGSKVHVQV